MVLEIFSVGNTGSTPLPNRFLSSFALRREGDIFLFDCGEATQIALKKIDLKLKNINCIFITHLHADHITGLPGILMLLTQTAREKPLHIIGPAPIKDYIQSNYRTLNMYKNYEIIIKEIDTTLIQDVFVGDSYKVSSFPVIHTRPCVGYVFQENSRPGKFDTQKAEDLGLPKKFWNKLQHFQPIVYKDKKYTPEMVLGQERKGRRVSYITDTTYPKEEIFIPQIFQSDYLVCESSFKYAEENHAIEKLHLSSKQAEKIAKKGQVKKLLLTHFSPRYTEKEIKELVKEVDFENVKGAYTGFYENIPYEE